MNGDEFGFGPCLAGTDRNWPCSQAAVDASQLCRWHMKVKFKIAWPYKPEAQTVPARKKAKAA